MDSTKLGSLSCIHLQLDMPWSVNSLAGPLWGWAPQPSAWSLSRFAVRVYACVSLTPPGQDPHPAPLPLAPGEPAGASNDAAHQGRRLMAGPPLSFPAPSCTVWLLPALGFGEEGGGREGKRLAVPFTFFSIQGLLLVLTLRGSAEMQTSLLE